MKKIASLLLSALFVFSFAACETEGEAHTHSLLKTSAKEATCTKKGNIAYWTCSDCEKIFSDSQGTTEISEAETLVEKLPHTLEKSEGRTATCEVSGRAEYWTCTVCEHTFADEAGTVEFEKKDAYLGYANHDLTHHAEVPVNGKENGTREYWSCSVCNKLYADETCKERLTKDELVLYSVMNIPDFTVEVDVGKDPVVLQLSDTQIIDAGQTRPGRDGVHWEDWATDKMDVRCYNYLTEVINATDPDLIIITGDIIYGEFDDNGSALTKFVEFMESFDIPWAPIFGNHDNESKMGVDWQCQQFENAENCLFEQKELTGNGNYSVGIVQGGEIKRMFYMLDSNGCGNASAESLANGHTKNNFVGFGSDQIAWYTNSIKQLKEACPDAKISFAYHIQQQVFAEAWKKYGFTDTKQDINLDTMEGVTDGDFGYIGRDLKGEWDQDKTVWKGMKALGVDSVFVGHEHCNNASVVYEGVRLQFGQKSTEYDRYNCISSDGVITGGYTKTGTPLIGGSVIVLSEEDATIKDAYVYYCGFEDGKIDWNQYKTYEVNGLQKGTDLTLEDGIEMVGVPFDENGNAYQVTANKQGKVLINKDLLKGKTTLSFSVYVPETSVNNLSGMGPFAIRLKPDDGSMANVPNAGNYSGKYYIVYKVSSTDATKIISGTWQTFTIDISSMNDKCTEFSFLIAQGNTIYFKDITIS